MILGASFAKLREHVYLNVCGHRNVVCVSGSENHRAAGNAPMDLRFFVLRSPCHVGGGREAGMHSNTRVNGFLGMQSEDIHTGA